MILTLIMICSVSSMLTAGSKTLKSIAKTKQLCTMQTGSEKGCANTVHRNADGSVPPGTNPADPNAPGAGNEPGPIQPVTTSPFSSWIARTLGIGETTTDRFLLALFGMFSWF